MKTKKQVINLIRIVILFQLGIVGATIFGCFMPGKVCADVVLVNPPGVVAEHTHTMQPNLPPPVADGKASDLKSISIGNVK